MERPITDFKFSEQEYADYLNGVEIWRDVEGWEGMYSVSTFGRIKSLERKRKSGKGYIFSNERILKNNPRRLRYTSVSLCNEGQKQLSVHRIVATEFVNNPYNKPEVNHEDSDPSNPMAYNLTWMTSSENQFHAYRFGNQVPPKNMLGVFGKDNHLSKKINQLAKDGKFIKLFYGSKEAERELGIQATNIRKCARGERPLAGGFRWVFA